jgi:hypothetical protein
MPDDIGDLLHRIRGLVLVTGLLERRGATVEELARHQAEAERLRWRLARLVANQGDRSAA